METNVVFTLSNRIRAIFYIISIPLLALPIYAVIIGDYRVYTLLFYLTACAVCYTNLFKKYIVTDDALVISNGFGSKQIISLSSVTKLTSQTKGFRIDCIEANNKKSFYIIKNVEDEEQFLTLLKSRISGVTA